MGYRETFIRVIIEKSDAETYDEAIKEWEVGDDATLVRSHDKCICGHKIHKIYTVSNLKDEILKIGCCCVRKFGTDEMIKKMNAIDKEKLEAENLQAVVLRAGKLLGAGIMTVDAVFVTENYDDKLQFKTRVRKKQSKRVLSYVLGEIKERIEYKCELEDLKPSMPFGYTKNSTMILHLINKNEFSFGEGIEYKIRIKMSNLWEYKGYGGISFHIDRKLTKIK